MAAPILGARRGPRRSCATLVATKAARRRWASTRPRATASTDWQTWRATSGSGQAASTSRTRMIQMMGGKTPRQRAAARSAGARGATAGATCAAPIAASGIRTTATSARFPPSVPRRSWSLSPLASESLACCSLARGSGGALASPRCRCRRYKQHRMGKGADTALLSSATLVVDREASLSAFFFIRCSVPKISYASPFCCLRTWAMAWLSCASPPGMHALASKLRPVKRGFPVGDQVPFDGAQQSSPRHSCLGGRHGEWRRVTEGRYTTVGPRRLPKRNGYCFAVDHHAGCRQDDCFIRSFLHPL